ncbi:MAG: hypothetical protein K2Y10_03030 [Burkholderiaceae bacterium]|nr:hypothetical protein [Burkholderiaceae bacterium]
MHPSSNPPSNPSGDLTEAAEINKEDDDSIAKGLGFTVVAITLLLVGAAAVAYFSKDIPQSFKDVKKFGEIGDFVGGILNPVISGCTLFIAYAVWKLQKAELAETRKELQESRKVMQEQTKIAEQQRSEQRFFDILKIYNSSLDKMEHSHTVAMGTVRQLHRSTGKVALSNILRYIFDKNSKLSCINHMDAHGFFGVVNYLSGIKDFNERFQSYCVVVFFLLNFSIENNKPKQPYAGLFSGQLTRDELIVIAIYSIINKNYCKDTLIILDNEINLFGNMGDDDFLKVIKDYLSSDTSFQEVKINAH